MSASASRACAPGLLRGPASRRTALAATTARSSRSRRCTSARVNCQPLSPQSSPSQLPTSWMRRTGSERCPAEGPPPPFWTSDLAIAIADRSRRRGPPSPWPAATGRGPLPTASVDRAPLATHAARSRECEQAPAPTRPGTPQEQRFRPPRRAERATKPFLRHGLIPSPHGGSYTIMDTIPGNRRRRRSAERLARPGSGRRSGGGWGRESYGSDVLPRSGGAARSRSRPRAARHHVHTAWQGRQRRGAQRRSMVMVAVARLVRA